VQSCGDKLVSLLSEEEKVDKKQPDSSSKDLSSSKSGKPFDDEDPNSTTAKLPLTEFQISAPSEKPQGDGTGTAKSTPTMQNTEETGQTVQNLPGKPAKAASLTLSVEAVAGKTEKLAGAEAQRKTNSPQGEVPSFVEGATAVATEQATTSVAGGKTSASMEPVEVQIRTQALEFQRLGSDSMSVVLKPDANLELHLQLRMDQGQIHVVAECKRGDATVLNENWGQLQQNLASQGIRVSALQDGNTAAFSHSNFQGQEWAFGKQQQNSNPWNTDGKNNPHYYQGGKENTPESKGARALPKTGAKRSLEWWA
jgi:hypothetical protein